MIINSVGGAKMNNNKKKSKLLIISAVLGVAYSLYLIFYFSDVSEQNIGGAIAATLVLPHMICTAIASIFNVVAVVTNTSGFALTGGILYSVAAVLFIVYGFFLVPMIVLSFIGFTKLKETKLLEDNRTESDAL